MRRGRRRQSRLAKQLCGKIKGPQLLLRPLWRLRMKAVVVAGELGLDPAHKANPGSNAEMRLQRLPGLEKPKRPQHQQNRHHGKYLIGQIRTVIPGSEINNGGGQRSKSGVGGGLHHHSAFLCRLGKRYGSPAGLVPAPTYLDADYSARMSNRMWRNAPFCDVHIPYRRPVKKLMTFHPPRAPFLFRR